MKSNENKSRLLNDLPSREDKFGSHGRVASAIIDLIKNGGSDGGHRGCTAIALEGTWGSGKSTVIEIVRTELSDELFVFDAWAHKGDPLRRVFLEQLIDFLKEKVPDKKKWERKRDELSKRIEDTETTTTPTLSRFGAVFGIFTLLLPLGTGFFAAGLRACLKKRTGLGCS